MLAKSRLLRSLNYLKISGAGLVTYNWIYPFIFTGITVAYLFIYPQKLNLTGDKDSILSSLVSILQILPGFYIAALAAVASFNRKIMDTEIDGNPVSLIASENGDTKPRSLTRRRLLCYLFGYLSFLSIALFLLGTLLQKASPVAIVALCNEKASLISEWLFFSFVLFFFYQMITVTFLGLFYLADRMHWKQPETRIK